MRNLSPLFQSHQDPNQELVELLDLGGDRFDESRSPHRLHLDDMLLEQSLYIVKLRKYIDFAVLEGHRRKVDVHPLEGQFLKELLETELLRRADADLVVSCYDTGDEGDYNSANDWFERNKKWTYRSRLSIRFMSMIFRNVVPALGVRSKPAISLISSQWR